MKEFSNETKSKRRKAILKVILKRYSFIVWVPALLIICNFIGVAFFSLIGTSATYVSGTFLSKMLGVILLVYANPTFTDYFLFTILGFMLLSTIFYMCLMIEQIIQYLKKGTIFKDFIDNLKLLVKIILNIFCFFISLPKKIFFRIKDEKRRFNNSLEKELGRNEND